jgi:pilus assembly protein CpaB
MGRRTLLLLAALVVAALGTLLVFLYAHNADTAAKEGQSLVKVLVAKAKIETSTSGTTASNNGAFEQQEIPTANVVPGALADATPLANLVALAPIFPGQQIITQQWGASAPSAGLSLPPGLVAMSVQLGDPQRVAGFVQPGSTVTIFVSGATPTAAPTGATAAQGTNVRTLLTGVKVVAVGPTTSLSQSTGSATGNTEAIPTAILTLAVTQDEAKKLVYVIGAPGASYSGLYFALQNADSKVLAPEQDTPMGAANLFTP